MVRDLVVHKSKQRLKPTVFGQLLLRFIAAHEHRLLANTTANVEIYLSRIDGVDRAGNFQEIFYPLRKSHVDVAWMKRNPLKVLAVGNWRAPHTLRAFVQRIELSTR